MRVSGFQFQVSGSGARVQPQRTPKDWHDWFSQQATWTAPARRWLYREARLGQAQAVLEVGCGTGVVTVEVARRTAGRVYGLDIDAAMLALARRSDAARYVQGDAHALPFADEAFDVVLSHYLLLWLEHPAGAVQEMARVTRRGGVVLACAEPDYGGRIDHPAELVRLGKLQTEALRHQGANPEIGRRLGELFSTAGLLSTVAVMAGQWELPGQADQAFAAEWATRRYDLAGLLPAEALDRLEEIDRDALRAGRRVLFVPTFYAIGRKGEE